MYDELGIGEVVDAMIPQDEEKRKISLGNALKAFVLNGLSTIRQRLWLFSKNFEEMDLEQLFGKESGVFSELLSDSTLGRALEKFHTFGTTSLCLR